MLRDPLPPIPWQPLGINAYLQSFALCYHVANSAGPTEPLAILPLQRAYGITGLIHIPRVTGNSPAALVVKIDYPWGAHLVIAIEGMRNVSQVYSLLRSASDSYFVAPVPGYVVNWAATYGAVLNTALTNNATFQTWYHTPSTRVTFAGYSLGASVAEYMAYIHALANPGSTYWLHKFAAPRTGTASWYANKPPNLDRLCLYHWGDHMHMLPDSGIATTSAAGFSLPTGISPYMVDPCAATLHPESLRLGTPKEPNLEDKVNFLAAFLFGPSRPGEIRRNTNGIITVTGPNAVYYHGMNSMRLLLNQRALHGNDDAAWRFNYLQMGAENSWQQNWRPGNVWEDLWTVYALEGPPEFVPNTPERLAQLREWTERMHNAPQKPPGAGLPGGMFNAPDPLVQGGRRRNRHHPGGE